MRKRRAESVGFLDQSWEENLGDFSFKFLIIKKSAAFIEGTDSLMF